jgi:enoyl-CoA hydratase/carnithine racemase
MAPVFKTISWYVESGIGLLTLNEPPKNSMTLRFFHELQQWQQEIYPTQACKAIIIHGSGRHFSSGANIDELLEQVVGLTPANSRKCSPEAEAYFRTNHDVICFFRSLDIPVIAAIRGVCIGSGLELAFACHFRFCGDKAVLGLPETTFNLMPGLGGIKEMTQLAGKAKGLETILSGQTFDGRKALDMGLVDALFPSKEVLSMARDFAQWLPDVFHKEMGKIYLKRFFETQN